MGRIFEKRKDRMFARWAKTSKAFTKVGKEIAIAVKLGGADPDNNPRLRMAIQTARSLNMPKDRIMNAVNKASSKDSSAMDEVNYEAHGPHGIAMIVQTATDNPTRTVANVRSIFNKYGGALGTVGSLDYLFDKKGIFTIEKPPGDLEEFELSMIDHGLEELFETDEGFMIYCSFGDFGSVQRGLEEKGIPVKSASFQRLPLSTVTLSPEQEAEVTKVIDLLEEDDDVQTVYHNLQYSS